jgi:hypothetical protein
VDADPDGAGEDCSANQFSFHMVIKIGSEKIFSRNLRVS